jgi:hypothetical protein
MVEIFFLLIIVVILTALVWVWPRKGKHVSFAPSRQEVIFDKKTRSILKTGIIAPALESGNA